MKKIPVLLAILLTGLTLTACTSLDNGQATVVEKKYIEEHTEGSFMMINNAMIPYDIYYPDEWRILLSQSGTEVKNVWFSVDESTYSDISLNAVACIQDTKVVKFGNCE